MNLPFNRVIYRIFTLSTLLQFSISISKGVEKEKKKKTHPTVHEITPIPVGSLKIALRIHYSSDYFCDSWG